MHSQRPHVDYKYSLHRGPMDVSTRCSVDVEKKMPAVWCYKQPLHWTKIGTLHSGYELLLSLHRMHVKNTMVEMVLCSCILYVMIRQKKKKTLEKENIVCVGEVIITVAIIKRKSRQR